MDIGTAKPDAAIRAKVPHHLLDLIDPTEAYSAARFCADAAAAIADIRARGRVPIVAGGTMLYFKALREGLSALPAADPSSRRRSMRAPPRIGWPAMHAELARIDPATAARLAPTDSQRIQRALEVHALTGRPLSALQGAREAQRGIAPAIVVGSRPPIARNFTWPSHAFRRDARARADRRGARLRDGTRCSRNAVDALGRLSANLRLPRGTH